LAFLASVRSRTLVTTRLQSALQSFLSNLIHVGKEQMADRGRGNARGGSRGRGRGGASVNSIGSERAKREAILDLSKYTDKRIRVKFTGGREVTGILKGYDQLLNLVLDDVNENIEAAEPHIRKIGLAVLRGPQITILSPIDGSEEIENPFGP